MPFIKTGDSSRANDVNPSIFAFSDRKNWLVDLWHKKWDRQIQSTTENLDVHVPIFVIFFYLTPLILSKSFNDSTDVPIDKINFNAM